MAFVYKLNSITFNDSETEPTKIDNVKCVTVFVGPNNCGKTTALKEILNYVTGKKEQEHVITKSFEEPLPSSYDDILNSYNLERISTSSGTGWYIEALDPIPTQKVRLDPALNSAQIDDKYNGILGKSLILYLNTEDRLRIIKRQDKIDPNLLHRSSATVLELYSSDRQKLDKVRGYFRRLFNEDVEYFDNNGGSIYFMMKNIKELDHVFDKMDKNELLDYDEKTPKFDDQGDGMKSSLGILCSILGTNRPIILLDEPEAFLHPPQTYEMGKIIGEISNESPNRQIFISTHSSDFLKGLLKASPQMDVVYLKRDGNRPIVNLVSNDFLQKINNDPFLSSINLLEGFFYNGTIVVEGQSDRIFYNNAFDALYPKNQLFYLEVGGKASFSDIAQRYHEAHVPFAIVSDFDIFFEASNGDFKKLVSALYGVDVSSKQNSVDSKTQKEIDSLVNATTDIITNVYNTKKTINLKSLRKSLGAIKTLFSNVNTDEIISSKDEIANEISELKTLMEPIESTYTDLRDSGINAVSNTEDKRKVQDLLSSCHENRIIPNSCWNT